MKRFDKTKNILKANILAEQRYLESKGLIKEANDRIYEEHHSSNDYIIDNIKYNGNDEIYSFDSNDTGNDTGTAKIVVYGNNDEVIATYYFELADLESLDNRPWVGLADTSLGDNANISKQAKEYITDMIKKSDILVQSYNQYVIDNHKKPENHFYDRHERLDENTDGGRTMDGYQAWVFNFQINHLIENLKKNDILTDYIERGEQSRFYIPMDNKQGYHPYLILGDVISKELNKSTNDVTNALKKIGQLKKRDSKIANSPIIYSDISGLGNFKELMEELFYELGLNVDEDTAKKIYTKYKDNSNVQGPTSKLFDISN